MNKPITLLIMSDRQVYRRQIQNAVENSGQIVIVGEGATLQQTARLPPDVILLADDFSAPGGNQVIPLIKQRYPASKIIVFGVGYSQEAVLVALKDGAQGYLVKGSSTNTEIVEAIQAVARGQAILSPQMLGWVLDTLNGK